MVEGYLHGNDVATIPWGVLILIGGSLAIASTFTVIGLNRSIASVISVDLGSDILMLVFIMTLTILMTELMSNTAIASLMLPVVKGIAMNI